MTTQVSRRGLFAAFRVEQASAPHSEDEASAMIARIGEHCVEPKGVTCRRCGDECEPRAIAFRPMGGGKARPALDAESCTGCAACVPVCPVGAIVLVPAERVHLIAGIAELARSA